MYIRLGSSREALPLPRHTSCGRLQQQTAAEFSYGRQLVDFGSVQRQCEATAKTTLHYGLTGNTRCLHILISTILIGALNVKFLMRKSENKQLHEYLEYVDTRHPGCLRRGQALINGD